MSIVPFSPNILSWMGTFLQGSGFSLPLLAWFYFTRRKQNLQQEQLKTDASATAVEGLSHVNAALQSSIRSLNGQVALYGEQIELLRTARWSVEDVLLELHSAAIAARSMVHDMQRSAGLQLTVFPALPKLGISATDRTPHAGATAADEETTR